MMSSVSQSRAASMIRQSGNILDIAQANCTRANRVLGIVHQYRVHLLMKDHCRAANSCKASLIVGAPRVACNGLCTAAKFHSADENPGCLLGCSERSDRLFTYPRVWSLWRLRCYIFNLRRTHLYEELTRVTVSISVSSCTASQNDDCPVSGVPTLSRRCVWDLALNN